MTLAAAYTSVARSAEIALAEALAAQGEAQPGDANGYAGESVVTALERLTQLARKYQASGENRAHIDKCPGPWPIITDNAFRAALIAVAGRLDECKALTRRASERVAATLREWESTRSPDCAVVLEVVTITVARILKREGAQRVT